MRPLKLVLVVLSLSACSSSQPPTPTDGQWIDGRNEYDIVLVAPDGKVASDPVALTTPGIFGFAAVSPDMLNWGTPSGVMFRSSDETVLTAAMSGDETLRSLADGWDELVAIIAVTTHAAGTADLSIGISGVEAARFTLDVHPATP